MPDDVYTRDILVWSEQQAALLRRLASGERVNADIDWENVIEEVESVGRSELHAVESLLTRAFEHLLKLHGWPDGPVAHWRHEALTFLRDARRHFSPSMRRVIDIAAIYADAHAVTAVLTIDGKPPRPLPATCIAALDDLILPAPHLPDIDALLARLAVAAG